MKTHNEILTDIFKLLKVSPIEAAITGGIYKRTRPTNSSSQDCVFHIIPGNNGKFLQNGALYIKIFYDDIHQNNTYYEDAVTGQQMEQLLYNFSTTLLATNGYSFDVDSRETYTELFGQEQQGQRKVMQHYAILKINFQITID